MSVYRHIHVDRLGDVFCVRLRKLRLEETEIQQLGEEIVSLCADLGCRKLAFSLGPEPPDCLYSVFLAKLIFIRNTLAKVGGQLVLCEVSPIAFSVFEACLLNRVFVFTDDFPAAIKYFAGHGE
jgi:hypothetical protein